MDDVLTGLPTHHDLVPSLAGDAPLALLVDTDGLIWINDQFGHQAGDRALTTVAAELKRCSARVERSSVLRVGGDEFLVPLPSLGIDDALTMASDIVLHVRALEIPYRRLDRREQTRLEVNVLAIRLTSGLVSQGFTGTGISRNLNEWAAQLVYEQKQRGGGQPGVVVDAHDVVWEA